MFYASRTYLSYIQIRRVELKASRPHIERHQFYIDMLGPLNYAQWLQRRKSRWHKHMTLSLHSYLRVYRWIRRQTLEDGRVDKSVVR